MTRAPYRPRASAAVNGRRNVPACETGDFGLGIGGATLRFTEPGIDLGKVGETEFLKRLGEGEDDA
jgi:hypothetical protein